MTSAPPPPPVSDDALRTKTGRGWDEWCAVLDAAGSAARPHKETARWLEAVHGLDGWWAQTVTVGYERARGLRAAYETPTGFQVGVSRTFPVAVERLFAACAGEESRRSWLGVEVALRTAVPPVSLRLAWPDGSVVALRFAAKGVGKSAVSVQHEKLPDAAAVERRRTFWKERLEALAAALG